MEPRPILDPKLRCARFRHLGRSCRIGGRSGGTPVRQLNASGMEHLRCGYSEARSRVTTSIGWSLSSRCSIQARYFYARSAAMHDPEGRRDVKPDQRADQFIRLREVIE